MDFVTSIKQTMHKLDLINYPYALYCNPADAESLKEKIPDNVRLVPTEHVKQGTSYLVDRVKCAIDYSD